MNRLIVGCLALLLVGCSSSPEGPPRISDLVGSPCAACGMIVEDARYAAGVALEDGTWLAFDAIECALRHVRQDPVGEVWLADLDGSAELVSAHDAVVVRAGYPSPMGGGYAAFADPDRARSEAFRRGGVAAGFGDFAAGRAGGGAP